MAIDSQEIHEEIYAKTRIETDSLGKVEIKNCYYYGAQTQRASNYSFPNCRESIDYELIESIALIKKVSAITNYKCGVLTKEKTEIISKVADEIITGKISMQHFPLTVWQSGSGTQTNMNVNEVIANRANEILTAKLGTNSPLHPNDDVNKSQSTNDVYPTAINITAYQLLANNLLPSLTLLRNELARKTLEFADIIKVGRTHLQDAVPLTLGQEFSGYMAQIESHIENINIALNNLKKLPIGGTAVGNGVNTPSNFIQTFIATINELTESNFVALENKFAGIAGSEAIVGISGTLRNLATALYKIVNDIRFLASGPRCGLGELLLPENEPGSSIMPGKVNPVQCEIVAMACAQVIGNDATIAFASSQGQFELNTFRPIMGHNLNNSIRILTHTINNFIQYALQDLKASKEKINFYLENSLMTVTELVPVLGYNLSAKIAQTALKENLTLRETVLKYNFLDAETFDSISKEFLKKYCS